jgi:hydrogenase expression/formation protein HypE
MDKRITVAHGGGGKLTHSLITGIFHKYFDNPLLLQNGDAAVFKVSEGEMSFSTDGYVITPWRFRGGNIGKLAVCGTVNDLAVSGAVPMYLSCGFIIEEGFELDSLEEIAASMAAAAKEAGISIVTGDTKVVPKGAADHVFIHTSGVGMLPRNVSISPSRIKEGDAVIISGTMGDHGTAIMLEREGFPIQSPVSSDCAPLNGMIREVTSKFGDKVHMMRDPTRGGVAATLNEIAEGLNFGIRLNEEQLPVKKEVVGICGMLGFDPLYIANEGKVLFIVPGEISDGVLEVLRSSRYGKDAAVIGCIESRYPGKVYLDTILGGSRIVDMPVGDQLPRIC